MRATGKPSLYSTLRSASGRGFSLIEMLATLLVLGIIVVTLVSVLYSANRSKTSSTNRSEATYASQMALDLISDDLRTAGFGADIDHAQPAIAYVDSTQVLISSNEVPYPDTLAAHHIPPEAYDPAGLPRPFPLNGTAWQPPIKYHTGAEVIRYTLDLNNDGVVNSSDQADPIAADAQRTPNPNDYLLVRQVYGDSTNFVAGNNGGTLERVALVDRPGGSTPPLFQVYMKGSSTPWNWANGAVPAAQLGSIARVVVNVTSSSGKADGRGIYAKTTATGEVNSMRNVPNFGEPEYVVDGYVYDDLNRSSGNKGSTEPGLGGVTVRLGNSNIGYTNASGYFMIHARAGTYALRHTPPAGYGSYSAVDSFVMTIPPATRHDFPDTARTGGWVTATVYNDQNNNQSRDGGEPTMSAIKITLTPGGATAFSDGSGVASVFASPGAYTLAVTPPDTMVCSTTNPVSGTMVNGNTDTYMFGLYKAVTGKIEGSVFRDNNRNGVFDAGEPGVGHVWVAATPDNGLTITAYQYTDSSGAYAMTVPANDPPATTPYSVMCIVPDGYFPTTTTAQNGLFVQSGARLQNRNFGIAGYQIITLNASRVLSLGSADLKESDWNGNHTENARQDADLVLGADAGGVDNVSVWFNRYDSSPLFSANPQNPDGYTRSAPQSVLTLALDTLVTNNTDRRPDLVTGTKKAAAGNLFIWLDQNSNGNEGYFPVAYSPGLGYTTLDAGDVQSVLTSDCAGLNMPDLIVGTKSTVAGTGTIEIWQNSNASPPTFTRQEVYPPGGTIPGGTMGEVTGMVLADLDNDGDKDLIVCTRTGNYTGQVLIFQRISKVNGVRFNCKQKYSITGAATGVITTDVNADGFTDIVVGTQTGTSTGQLKFFRNDGNILTLSMTLARTVNAPGIVTSLCAADLGGGSRKDVVCGWRQNDTSYLGGVSIFYTDLGTLPLNGVDPSGGSIFNMVPAITTNNFNYGVKPSVPAAPYLPDIAVGLKSSATTGALVIFIR